MHFSYIYNALKNLRFFGFHNKFQKRRRAPDFFGMTIILGLYISNFWHLVRIEVTYSDIIMVINSGKGFLVAKKKIFYYTIARAQWT
jgi:hypothetical protein